MLLAHAGGLARAEAHQHKDEHGAQPWRLAHLALASVPTHCPPGTAVHANERQDADLAAGAKRVNKLQSSPPDG